MLEAILAVVVEHEQLVLDDGSAELCAHLVHDLGGLCAAGRAIAGRRRTEGAGLPGGNDASDRWNLAEKRPGVGHGIADVLVNSAVPAVRSLLDGVVLHTLAGILRGEGGGLDLELVDGVHADGSPDKTDVAGAVRRGQVDAVDIDL